jgi:hypothetical protein
MSIHLLIQGGFRIYGTAAIPSSSSSSSSRSGATSNGEAYDGGSLSSGGNIITCTIQGFFLHTCMTTYVLYYCSLSVYSYVNVLNNFDKTKYIWIEKYIHIIVHIYPFCTALYIVSVNGFNNKGYGFCGIASAPLGCEEFESTVPCERGPKTNDSLRTLQWIGIVPDIFVIIFPTIVMTMLYYKVKQQQSRISILAKAIAYQSCIYLAVIYVADIPFLIGEVIELRSDGGKLAYQFNMFAVFIFSLFGFFTLLVYIYFTLPRKEKEKENSNSNSDSSSAAAQHSQHSHVEESTEYNGDDRNSNSNTTTKTTSILTISSSKKLTSNLSKDYIFSCEDLDCDEEEHQENSNTKTTTKTTAAAATTTTTPNTNNNNRTTTTTTTTTPQQKKRSRISKKFSFNIFDGTNAKGDLAQFIVEGDSDDERKDDEETQQWSSVQNHV